MAEFKFSCPHCQQHIQCDASYAGVQITCPTCQKSIVVPTAPSTGAPPPPPPSAPGLATQQATAAPAAGKRFTGTAGAPKPAKKSSTLKIIVGVTSALAGLAIGYFAVNFALSHLGGGGRAKANPAAHVPTPTANEALQALGILSKVHASYTNLTSVSADGTITLFLNVSNITQGDLTPNMPQKDKAASRHPQGMPRIVQATMDVSVKQAHTNWFCFSGDVLAKIDRMEVSNTFAFWASDKGRYMFSDSHQKGVSATYQQLPDVDPANDPSAQIKNIQQLFQDPAQLSKIIKDLGQGGDESVNGKNCYTLVAKVLGQKIKLWVDKTSYLVSQWEITLGGQISDADVDDLFSLIAVGFTNAPQMQLDTVKTQIKTMTPVMTKIRGNIKSTSRSIEVNPTLTAEDFSYSVPAGVSLIHTPAMAGVQANAAARQRNACITNLRQIDAAKNQFALERRKTTGYPVSENDIKPYIKLDARGNLPKCPGGGKYIIGKVGEPPTCSAPDHILP